MSSSPKQVFILRGIPGSGKSFQTRKLLDRWPDAVVCSADHFFLSTPKTHWELPRYDWDARKIRFAHQACEKKFLENLVNPAVSTLILDNTNIQWISLKFYVQCSAWLNAQVHLVESRAAWRNDPGVCFLKNQHGVPLQTILRMHSNYQTNEHIQQQALEQFQLQVDVLIL